MEKSDMIIAIPRKRRTAGVYVFFNPVKKRVYVGETIDNYERFEQHVNDIFVDSKYSNGTNINLKSEECKTFEVEFFGVSKKKKEDLLDYETALMCFCRENGFKLYNGGKDNNRDNIPGREYLISDEGNVEWEECKKKVTIYNKNDIDNKYEEISKMFKDWLDNSGYSDAFLKEDRENREKIWSERVKVLKDSEDYDLVPSSGKINGKKTLNKEDMDKCNIDGIRIKSLLDDYNTDYAVWSPFGLYGGQGPITILETKMHDIENLKLERSNGIDDMSFTIKAKGKGDNTSEGICVWSLTEWGLEYMRKQLASMNNREAFRGKRLLFLPYTSSNNAVDVFSLDIEKRDDENINEYHKRLKQKQKNNFATSYRINESGEDITFPKEMFPEVLRLDSNRGSMAFLISKFYYINDINSSNIDKFKSAIQVTSKNGGDKDLKDSHTGAPCHLINKIDKERLELVKTSYKEKDEISLLVAELEYPYVVEISNTPNLSLYLKGVDDNSEKSIPRILFDVTGIENNRIKNGIVKCAYAFNGDEVYVFNDGETRMGDLIAEKEDDDNSDNKILECIKEQVKINDDNAKQGEYILSFEVKDNIRYEVINIIVGGKEYKKIRLNCKKQFTPRAMDNDLYKYYCFENKAKNKAENEDDNSIWAFRYKKGERKNGRPLFVFDDESELSLNEWYEH